LSKFYTYIVLLLAFVLPSRGTDIPHIVNYQGKLTDSTGVAINDTVTIIFRVYDADSAGTVLWMEAHPLVPVFNGLFDTRLVETIPMLLAFDEPYFLELEVNSEVFSPRIPFSTVPYSFRAVFADSCAYADSTGTVFWGNIVGIPDEIMMEGEDVALLNIDTLNAYAETTHTHALADLSDVDTSGILTGNVLKWNGSTWIPAIDDTGSIGSTAVHESLFIWNQDTIAQPADMRITGTAIAETLDVTDIRGQGSMYSDVPAIYNISMVGINVSLATLTYGAGGSGSAISLSFDGVFDDQNGLNGANFAVEIVRNPGMSETIVAETEVFIFDEDFYKMEPVTLKGMDTPPTGSHDYEVRARALTEPYTAGRCLRGRFMLSEIKE